ncbi:hypothetical protein [Pseudomonas poae]|uniref:hypothetical protein n=1 Tax=Pseudomonas poae TaxID=200451 RepID=UPI00223B7EBB|nr:hypothetical protein [Pseudomonas poae]
MQLSNQPAISPRVPMAHPHTSGTAAPLSPEVPGTLNATRRSTHNQGHANRYPVASDAEIRAHNTRGLKGGGLSRARPPVSTPPAKPPVASKPSAVKQPVKTSVTPKPPVLNKPVRPKGTKGALSDSNKLAGLHKNNAFPPLSTQLAASARSAFVNSAVGSLINIPFTVAQHLASQGILNRIEAQARMPGAEQVNSSGVKTTVDPGATQQQKTEARLENNEIKLELMVNSILSINEGPDAAAVSKGPGSPTDTNGRLASLEKTMDVVEAQMKDIAKRYGLVYDPYVAPDSSEAPTEKSRLDVIEQRLIHMNRMLKRLIRNAEADAEDAE